MTPILTEYIRNPEPAPKVPRRKHVIIGDIDCCVIDNQHRVPHMLKGDWDTYNALHVHDTAMPAGVAIYRKFLEDPYYTFFFITGRPERDREFTLKQLRKHVSGNIIDAQLLMRPDSVTPEIMHDSELKPYLLRNAGFELEEVLVAFDDRNSVVEGWRKLGVVCYQTQEGNF